MRRGRLPGTRTSPSTPPGRRSSPFEEIVHLSGASVELAPGWQGGSWSVRALASALGAAAGQTLLSAEELAALGDDLLTSSELPRGTRRLGDWLGAGPGSGKHLATGEQRPWG